MIGFALNQFAEGPSFNDWYLNANNNIATVTGVDCIFQSINNALWLFLGEYEYNTEIGIPYKRILGVSPIDKTLYAYHIKRAILNINNFIPANELVDLAIQESMAITFNYTATTSEKISARTLIPIIYLQLANGSKFKYELDIANSSVKGTKI